MSDIKLTCNESPLSWPQTVTIDELKVCTTCPINLYAPNPGSLQILSRRPIGDGVNIEESNSVGADYHGQLYSLEDAVFHTPGLHIFPATTELYPAEYHINMVTMSEPKRYLTLVIPLSHEARGKVDSKPYFAAARGKPDPAAIRPTLTSIIDRSSKVVQFQGPDLRGACQSSSEERQFLLVLNPVSIRASDLERIPREGSRSIDPRDLPAPGLKAKNVLPRDRLLRTAILAVPGFTGPGPGPGQGQGQGPAPEPDKKELECKPVKVVDGRDVVDVSGQSVDILKLLGIDADDLVKKDDVEGQQFARGFLMFLGSFMGLAFAAWICSFIWPYFFEGPMAGEPMFYPLLTLIAILLAANTERLNELF